MANPQTEKAAIKPKSGISAFLEAVLYSDLRLLFPSNLTFSKSNLRTSESISVYDFKMS